MAADISLCRHCNYTSKMSSEFTNYITLLRLLFIFCIRRIWFSAFRFSVTFFTSSCFPAHIYPWHKIQNVRKLHSEGIKRPRKSLEIKGFRGLHFYSHSTNSSIWSYIWCVFASKIFAKLLIFYLLFSAVNFLSIKIVS